MIRRTSANDESLYMNPRINEIRQDLQNRFSRKNQPVSHFKLNPSATLSQKIDHTCLLPAATQSQIEKLCEEAKEYGFYSVCVAPSFLELAAQRLAGTSVKSITVVGFPWGYQTTETKIFETMEVIAIGAQEIDMVLNIGKLKSNLLDEVYHDIFSVVERAKEIPVKVILETSLLNEHEKIQACILSQMAGASYVKTSTGFGSSGAIVDDVKLMKEIVGDQLGVKASGGIKNFEIAEQMIQAGADRIGTSSGVQIIKESHEKNR